jgi:precorrin-4/cobalt-precorrin-4 C11-methyltransferase
MAEIAQAHARGQDVARLHSGDLSVWSAMGSSFGGCAMDIPFTVTPGACLCGGGGGVGMRIDPAGTGPIADPDPYAGAGQFDAAGRNLRNFAMSGATLAIHLSIHNLAKVVEDLAPSYGGDCPVAVVWRASDQRIVRATLATVEEAVAGTMERTALILVGPVLNTDGFGESSLYAADYDRRFRPQNAASRFAGSRNECSGPLIAAPSSGAGKTTVMLGLLRALRQDGAVVQPFKNGPDYIDPAFHRAACGRPSFNLDSWAMGEGLMDSIAAHCVGADMVLAEGSMGLFDGVAAAGAGQWGQRRSGTADGVAGGAGP